MNLHNYLILLALSPVLAFIGILMVVFFFEKGIRARRRPERRANATISPQARRESHDTRVAALITRIHVEASFLRSWWIVTAEWSDPETGRVLTFRSHRFTAPPQHRPGEQIIVNVDTARPKHYRMEL